MADLRQMPKMLPGIVTVAGILLACTAMGKLASHAAAGARAASPGAAHTPILVDGIRLGQSRAELEALGFKPRHDMPHPSQELLRLPSGPNPNPYLGTFCSLQNEVVVEVQGQELTVGTQVVDSAPEAYEAAARLRWTDVTPARGSWGKVFETADGDDVSFIPPNGEGPGGIQLSHRP